MARAAKCDRCGVLYEYYNNVNSMNLGETGTTGGGFYTMKEKYDLCPACMNQLQQWLNGYGELEEAKKNG